MIKNFNIITYCVIWFAVVANIIFSCSQLMSFVIIKSPIYLYNVVMHLIAAYVLYLIVGKKKESGFWAFLVLNMINSLAIGTMDGNFLIHIMVGILYGFILFGLLLIKKDGISGWSIIKSNNNTKKNEVE